MSKYRTIDCELWARQFITSHPKSKLIKIVPRGAPVLGGVLMPDGTRETTWHYHFAAECKGMMYDEAYPNGLPRAEFENRFDERAFIDFIPYF